MPNVRAREDPGSQKTGAIVMSALEANKSIALRLIGAFNDRQLDLLEEVIHPRLLQPS
jgi:hypothetical protein